MKPTYPSRGGLVVRIPTALALASCLSAAPVAWDDSNATGAWSTAANWDTNIEPTAADDLTFPGLLAGTITLATGENAKSLLFDGNYTLTGGTLTLASGGGIAVATGSTATIASTLTVSSIPMKSGDGTLVLSGNNSSSNTLGLSLTAGKVRAASTNALGSTAAVTAVNGGTTLEVANGIAVNNPITLVQGGTVTGLGTSTSNGKITIDAAASSVTLATDQAADIFTIGNGANDVTGGTGATVIGVGGAGTVRLGFASDFDGSWSIPAGRLDLGATNALGDQSGSSLTLAGGALAGRMSANASFTSSAGNNLVLTADSSLIADRSGASTAAVTYTFGSMAMGGHTLTVAPGVNATGNTAAIVVGNVTLTGNPTFAINDLAGANGKLTTGSLLGGAARTVVKTGSGDLSVTGGATDLPVGSTFTASGGGVVEMLFASLGSDPTVSVSAVQNPFGTATISITDGTLRLAADGSGTSLVQTYQVASSLTAAGDVTLDPDRRTVATPNTNKTFELTGLTLAAGAELAVAGANTHGLRLTGPLALSGDAVLKGASAASKAGLLVLNGGISGAAGDSVDIEGGTSLLNLTINAASTYGGGTAMSGSNVTLNVANGFGPGATTLSGGTLTLNAATALAGTVVVSGGTLVANGANMLATNPVVLSGGILDLRNDAGIAFTIPSLTVSGNSGFHVARVASGSSQVITLPAFDVSGDTTLTLTSANSFIPNFSDIELGGNLTFNQAIAATVQAITEDGTPRTVLKTGTGTLTMQAASGYSGGTEVLAGTLDVEHAGALGSGALTVGATSGTTTATAAFAAGLAIPNDIVIRSGSSGAATLRAEGALTTWNGDLDLQKTGTLENSGVLATVATFNGLITGGSDLIKTGAGEIKLANAANSFGSGTVGSVTASAGPLSVDSDSALGNTANGVTISGTTGALKIDSTFGTARTLTFSGTSTGASSGIFVSSGQDFTVNAPIAGSGLFRKSGTGMMTFAPGVDSSGRGGAATTVSGGTLRVQGVKNLSNGGTITAASGGTIAFVRDADTNFGNLVAPDGTTGVIHVDRGIGGSGVNGRHTLGNVLTASGDLTVTGGNGYGLSLGSYEATASPELINNAPGELIVASIYGNPGTGSPTMTVGGSGDIEITGAISEDLADSGSYALTKSGSGTFTVGSAISEFGRLTTIQDGTLDLNGLTHAVNALTFGGAASASGATLVTGPSGSVQLGGTLTFSTAASQATALFLGNLNLGAASRSFAINNNGNLPVDLIVDGQISGSAGAAIAKSGLGTLRLSGAGNTQPGAVSVSAGALELAKSSGLAVGLAGLNLTNNGAVVRLVANEQIDDAAPVAIGDSGFFELDGFIETTGAVTMTQATPNQYGAIKTGAAGKLVLGGDLVLNNNTNTPATTSERNLLITGSGTKSVATTTGTLDLGGVNNRTIHVASTGPSVNANATIETQIINGGIVKTGPRILVLGHPNNTFAGGLQIAEGTVKPASAGSLGTGPVTFTNAPGTPAGIDFSSATGIFPGKINTGTGDFTFTYAAPAPSVLTLAGGFDLQQNLTVDVVNGSVQNGTPTEVLRAVVNVTGGIADAAGTFDLTKLGDGMLKLAAGNTYSGSTLVQRGILSVAADSSLGDTTVPITLDGGCLEASNSFTLTRDLVIGAGGGSLRSDFPRTMSITGSLDWGSATTGTDGSGRIVISGTTTGSGNLKVGEAINFAAGTVGQQLTWNARVCLQGPAALPSGNLNIGGFGVLELGNGDFSRPLGTGPGEVQLATNAGGGWAAVGADRTVNIGGAGDPLTWGPVSPPLAPFLYFNGPGSGDVGQLVLGSFSATHTVEFQNDLVVPPEASFFTNRQVTCWNGAAAIDGRITGDAIQNAPTKVGVFTASGDGTLEMAGDLLGRFSVYQNGQGTTILSGNNTGLTEEIAVFEGTLVLANEASLGSIDTIIVFPGTFHSELDASALPGPLSIDGSIDVNGLITGDVLMNGWLSGDDGVISGDLTVPAGSSIQPGPFGFMPTGTLSVGGNFTMESGAYSEFQVYGTVPDVDHDRINVTGAVNLAGSFYAYDDGSLVLNDTMVLILNDGIDPINGTFDFLPEGGIIPIDDQLAFQVTYLANGDGGAIGNDFGVTVVPNTSTDLSLYADAPVAVDLGAPITIFYTVENFGPNPMPAGELQITLPPNATFVSSTPAGTLTGNLLQIPIPAMALSDITNVELQLTAPGIADAIFVDATVYGSNGDSFTYNNSAPALTAVLPGGCPVLGVFTVDSVNDQLTLGIDTLQDVRYLLEGSVDLDYWYGIEEFIGNGAPYEIIEPMDDTKEFYRFRILPYGGGGGGEGS